MTDWKARAATHCGLLTREAGDAGVATALKSYLSVLAGQLARYDTPANARRVLINLSNALAEDEEAAARAASATNLPLIAQQVCNEHDVSVRELKGRSNVRNIAWARQDFMWRARQVRRENGDHRYSLSAIGGFLGRHHATVMYGVRVHAARLAEQPMKAVAA